VVQYVLIRGIRESVAMTSRSVAAPGGTRRACRTSSGRSSPSSFGVTALSERLKAGTYASLAVKREIAVIPTFLQCGLYRRTPAAATAEWS
jgi:hypothetical protein